jgi:glutamate synthase domain-containing protein 1
MCGIVGYLRKAGCTADRLVGTVVLEMLRALSTRGPDSTGVALYGTPRADELRVRLKLADGEPDASVEQAVLHRVRAVTPVHTSHRDGECLRLVVQPAEAESLEREILQAAPEAEVFSIGARLELMKQVGPPDALERQFHVAEMAGTHAIGHTRLSTESRVDISHSQPFWTHGVTDLAVVHNGHITNYHKLRRHLERRGYRFYTENDSEIIGPYLLEQMKHGATLPEAMERSTRDLDGTFCYLVASAEGLGLAKDFFCSKPLVLVETDAYVAIATEELAIRRALPDAPSPIEPGANAVRFWGRA